MLVVGVQGKDTVHSTFYRRADFVIFSRNREHHVQEVSRVAQIVTRINKWLTNVVFVTHRYQGRHLCDQTVCTTYTHVKIRNVQVAVVERGHRTNSTVQHRHRVSVITETMEEHMNLLMYHSVALDSVFEFFVFFFIRCITVQQHVTNFQIVGITRQFVDWEAAV